MSIDAEIEQRRITCRGNVLVGYDVVQRYRSVLFDPLTVK